MHPFLQATIGGVLIGLSSWLVLAAFGRVTGISGLTMGPVQPEIEKRSLSAFVSRRAAFIAGLIMGGPWVTNV
ncbi:MAG: hypothetical protein ACO3GJ_07330, partial [Burkholderiaceae bacterium]